MSEPQIRETVLVVDDSPESLGFLTEALESDGRTVLVAPSGEAALRTAGRLFLRQVVELLLVQLDLVLVAGDLQRDGLAVRIERRFLGRNDRVDAGQALKVGGNGEVILLCHFRIEPRQLDAQADALAQHELVSPLEVG